MQFWGHSWLHFLPVTCSINGVQMRLCCNISLAGCGRAVASTTVSRRLRITDLLLLLSSGSRLQSLIRYNNEREAQKQKGLRGEGALISKDISEKSIKNTVILLEKRNTQRLIKSTHKLMAHTHTGSIQN